MEVICFEEPAFYPLQEQAVERLKDKADDTYKQRKIDDKEAIKLLNIKAKSILKQLRDQGKSVFHSRKKSHRL